MHVQLLLASALLITTASAVPLEPTKDGNYKPISVIDLPASAPIVEETPAGSQESKETPDVVLNPVAASTPDQEDVIGDKRKPTILIIQRRPLFPFTFTNPFLNRRPLFSRPVFGTSSSEELLDDVMGFRRPQEDPFDSLATRLQSQMSSLWDTILGPPLRPVKNEEEETPLPRPQAILPNRPLFFQPSFLFPKIPAVTDIFKTENITGNSTTSETKTVDGHIVTVNKTQHVIRDKDNNPSGFFQIQVVDVRATNPPSTTSGDVVIKEVKPVDNEETGDSKVKVFEIQSVDPSSNEVEAAKPEQGVSKGIDDGLLE